MVIPFSLLSLSLVVASQTQVGKMSSEINSVMPSLVIFTNLDFDAFFVWIGSGKAFECMTNEHY